MTAFLNVPFLTDLDSRAAVKGSRDPLGTQAVWTRLGRTVVGNLTTVSSNVRDFTTTLLGYWFAEKIADEHEQGSELATFLKWEQLAAYCRAGINHDYGFRGTERARRNLSEGSVVTLSSSGAAQILSNQKIYGLWGLYSVPARASGLLADGAPQLTLAGRNYVERTCIPKLTKATGREASKLKDLLKRSSVRIDISGRDGALCRAVAAVLEPKLSSAERGFFREHLLDGGPDDITQGRQKRLASLITEMNQGSSALSPASLRSLEKRSRRKGKDWHPLADRLDRVIVAESVLAPASMIFNWLLGLHGKTPTAISKSLRDNLGPRLTTVNSNAFSALRGDISAIDEQTIARWTALAAALEQGDYRNVVQLLIEQNAAVMKERGGASWLEVRAGRLHVRFRDEYGYLPDRDSLKSIWRFPYFIPSLQSIGRQLES